MFYLEQNSKENSKRARGPAVFPTRWPLSDKIQKKIASDGKIYVHKLPYSLFIQNSKENSKMVGVSPLSTADMALKQNSKENSKLLKNRLRSEI